MQKNLQVVEKTEIDERGASMNESLSRKKNAKERVASVEVEK